LGVPTAQGEPEWPATLVIIGSTDSNASAVRLENVKKWLSHLEEVLDNHLGLLNLFVNLEEALKLCHKRGRGHELTSFQ
jgi:hypothetical protein